MSESGGHEQIWHLAADSCSSIMIDADEMANLDEGGQKLIT